jgi:predicted O-methyltransferase YrrM
MEVSLLQKLIAADPWHRTRLHDARGNLVSFGRLLRHAGPCLWTLAALKLAGRRPEAPFIPYDAAGAIGKLLRGLGPESRVLEFGSGMSTLWLARRCGRLFSVEHSAEWFAIVSGELERQGLDNVTYALRPERDGYVGFPEGADPFDLVIVDGSWRKECFERAVERLKPGGFLYVDDTDKASILPDGDLPKIEALVRRTIADRGGETTYYTDLAPTQFIAKQGLLVTFH